MFSPYVSGQMRHPPEFNEARQQHASRLPLPPNPSAEEQDKEVFGISQEDFEEVDCLRVASHPRLPPSRSQSRVPASTTPDNRHEVVPSSRAEHMESRGAGAVAGADVLSPLTYGPEPAEQMTMADNVLYGGLTSNDHISFPAGGLQVGTPTYTFPPNPFEASCIRETGAERQSSPTSTGAASAARILSGSALPPDANNEFQGPLDYMAVPRPGSFPFEDFGSEALVDGDTTDNDVQHTSMQAYAKLVFADGDYYVRHRSVTIGRDMGFWRDYKRRLKEQRRAEQGEEAEQEKRRAVAEKALRDYEAEPSGPSQPDEGDRPHASSKSSQSLEGRPAPALPSNFSEAGGVMRYDALSDNEFERQVRRQKRILNSKSSSTGSIAPQSLHTNIMDGQGYINPSLPPEADHAFIPVHPLMGQSELITKISKEHLRFSYNSVEERWELTILGRSAMVNDQIHYKGEMIPLANQMQIEFASISILFKLPDQDDRASPGPSRGTFSSVYEEKLDEPPRTSPAAVDLDSDVETTPIQTERKKKLPKLKLKTSKKTKEPNETIKTSPTQADHGVEASPQAPKKLDKGKKMPEGTKDSASGVKQEQTSPSAPAQTPAVDLAGAFQGYSAEELPEKRKGPGRPPKNGLVSKRDLGFVNKKKKEFQKLGLEVPSLNELVAIVRAENKAKEAMAKAAARGEALPEANVLQTIEADATSMPAISSGMPTAGGAQQGGVMSAEPVKRLSPKPARRARSPSPQKPQSEYTEEDLKKPSATYVIILDEILRQHPDGEADLQDIYDRICKKYPYFKYVASTQGWQSSVRHNLLQNPRFKDCGRSGKGKFWAIDYSVPLEKEKKRRITPPLRPPIPQMPNGQYAVYGQPGHPGQPGYVAPPYGQQNQPPPNQGSRPGHYYSPYAPSQHGPSGTYAGPHGQAPPPVQPQGMPLQPPHPGTGPSNANGMTPPAPTPKPAYKPPPPEYKVIIDAICAYHGDFMASHAGVSQEEHERLMKLFQRCTSKVSDYYQGTAPSISVDTDEENTVVERIKDIFKRNGYDETKQKPAAQTLPPATTNVPNAPNSAPASAPSAAAPQPVQPPTTEANLTSSNTESAMPQNAPPQETTKADTPVRAEKSAAEITDAPHPTPFHTKLSTNGAGVTDGDVITGGGDPVHTLSGNTKRPAEDEGHDESQKRIRVD
ncbi:hypothetical protein M433DRAFT_134249 [Acidomyces richmondensis BFW]|nr:hypothetical protein M433DRAFT_134249 [Acidomyces richmondensis BFW]